VIRIWMARLMELTGAGSGIGVPRGGPQDLEVRQEAVSELALLRNRRCRLQEMAHCYRDFGFHTMVEECKTSILALDRKIQDLRSNLRRGSLRSGS
jgi:hypothetical protein